MSVDAVFIVRKFEQKVSKYNKGYLDIIFADKAKEISAKLWDINGIDAEKLRSSRFLRAKGTIELYQGALQMRIETLEAANPEGPEIDDLVDCAPINPETMYNQIISKVSAISDETLREVCQKIYNDRKTELMYFPAAKNVHHNTKGGLLHHTLTMLECVEAICVLYPFLDKDLMVAGAALHDIGKIKEMHSELYGVVTDYTLEGNLIGHITTCVVEIEVAAQQLGFAEDEAIALLKHIVLAHHGINEYGSPKTPMFAEAEALYIIDLLDSRMFQFEKIAASVEKGMFSAKVFSLDGRMVYNHGRKPNGNV